MSKYKVEIELDFDKRPSKKDVLDRLWDILRDNKVKYKLHKYNNSLYERVERSIKNDKHK
jgi:esterase/lipase superfamily enzyme